MTTLNFPGTVPVPGAAVPPADASAPASWREENYDFTRQLVKCLYEAGCEAEATVRHDCMCANLHSEDCENGKYSVNAKGTTTSETMYKRFECGVDPKTALLWPGVGINESSTWDDFLRLSNRSIEAARNSKACFSDAARRYPGSSWPAAVLSLASVLALTMMGASPMP